MTTKFSDAREPAADVSAAVKEFLALEDQGLTKEEFIAFITRCERKGEPFLDAVKHCLRAYATAIEFLRDME